MIPIHHLSCLYFCMSFETASGSVFHVCLSQHVYYFPQCQFCSLLPLLFHLHFKLPCVHFSFLSSTLLFPPFWLSAPVLRRPCSLAIYVFDDTMQVSIFFFVIRFVYFLLSHQKIIQNKRSGIMSKWHRSLVFAVVFLFIHSWKEVMHQSWDLPESIVEVARLGGSFQMDDFSELKCQSTCIWVLCTMYLISL